VPDKAFLDWFLSLIDEVLLPYCSPFVLPVYVYNLG